jgi:nitrite reductase (NADH) large subunit
VKRVNDRIVIVGNGMASVRLVEALSEAGLGPRVTVIGAETQPGYNRVLLSALLAGDVSGPEILLRDRAWYEARGVSLMTGAHVRRIDPQACVLETDGGETIGYASLVLATGSEPVRLPLPGQHLSGVMTFRDIGDVERMADAARRGDRVAVIGGGLLGLEAAYGLAKLGADVTVLHGVDRLMERQLDAPAAALLRKLLFKRGVKTLLSRQTIAITGTDHVTGVAFADGSSVPADLMVMAVGIRPRAELARSAGAVVNRGIVVDDAMRTSLPGVFAIGECAEHRGTVYGLVEPAYRQAETVAAQLRGNTEAAFEGLVLATNLKVSGVPVFSAGAFMGGEGTNSVTLEDKAHGIYKKLVFQSERLVGAVLAGEADDALWYLDLIRCGTDVSAMRSDLIHGRDFAVAA